MSRVAKTGLILWFGGALWCAIPLLPSGTLLENDDVRVTRALEKPHVKGNFHDHKVNRVMVYLQNGRQKFEYQDGRAPLVMDWKAGQAVWSAAEGMHSPEVVSDDPFNIVEVELKHAGGTSVAAGSGDLLRRDARHFHMEFENPQVRVLRMNLGGHEATPRLDETRRTLEVFLSDASVKVTSEQGAVATESHHAGDVAWVEPGTRLIENTSEAPLEMVVIELTSR